MHDAGALAARPTGVGGASALQNALLDSRQRMRDMLRLATDFAFETDADGRFVFLMPERVLGWHTAVLLGEPASALLAHPECRDASSPFSPATEMRHRRTWVRHADGSMACLSISSTPLADSSGRITGGRGTAHDVTGHESCEAQLAAALRRSEVLDRIVEYMGRHVNAGQMLTNALRALADAVGAEGAAVIETATATGCPSLLHEAGAGAAAVLADAGGLMMDGTLASEMEKGQFLHHGTASCGRQMITAACLARAAGHVGLALWMAPGARDWDMEDHLLVAASVRIIRFALEHGDLQREMAVLARTDPLTGLLNRRAFLEETARRFGRLDRNGSPGTVLYTDLDHFKDVNDRFGHETGDGVLVHVASLLRDAVRPTDLVARLGGDEFAIWMDGVDQAVASSRAETICRRGNESLRMSVQPCSPAVTMSVGIAIRLPGSGESVDGVIRRADAAMYQVKRGGRGHWCVAGPAENTAGRPGKPPDSSHQAVVPFSRQTGRQAQEKNR